MEPCLGRRDHSLHGRATQWFGSHTRSGWASLSHYPEPLRAHHVASGYPHALPVRAVIERLAEASASTFHIFWPDDFSLLDAQAVDSARIHGPRQLTNLYLLALAVGHPGHFVTFDSSVSIEAVRRARSNTSSTFEFLLLGSRWPLS